MGVCISRFVLLKKLNTKGDTRKNVELKNFTTFRLGGKAKYFLTIKTLENFLKVMDYIEKHNLEYFILGAGSNVLIADSGYNGIVIKLGGDISRISIDDDLVEVGAGARAVEIYTRCRDASLSGLETLATIPATIGGMVYMNAGAYGVEIGDITEYVVAYTHGKIKFFTRDECGFDYRKSVFQSLNSVILRVGLRLRHSNKEEIHTRYLEVLKQKQLSQPLDKFSAGSVFRRIEGLSISKMLDDMGSKGMSVGGAMVSTKHANFIINEGARAQEVFDLIQILKKKFKDTYGIDIKSEIKFLGDFYETNG